MTLLLPFLVADRLRLATQWDHRDDWKHCLNPSSYYLGWSTIPVVVGARSCPSDYRRAWNHNLLHLGDVLAQRSNGQFIVPLSHQNAHYSQVPQLFFTNRTTFSGYVP